MSAKNGKSKISRKNILMLVRTCVIAAFALILTVAATLAWFMTDPPKADYLQVEVSGGLKANVKLFWGKVKSGSESALLYYGINESTAVDLYNYTTDITNRQAANYVPFTEVNIAPGSGDCYMISIKLNSTMSSARMNAQLSDVRWNENLSKAEKAQMKEHIWVKSFLRNSASSSQTKIFEWWNPDLNDTIADYKGNAVFASNLSVGADEIFYYYMYLDSGFTIDFSDKEYLMGEPLFTVNHIKVNLYKT